MNRCIFCNSVDGPFSTREHILPESLGGGDWAILPPGLFCDSCQNRFGSSIEQQALGDYPFTFLRTFLCIPTKKRKAPWFDSWEGRIEAGPTLGTIGYDPAPPFAPAFADRSKTVMRLLAEPLKPEFVCRTLLKMGLETVAADETEAVFSARFDAARQYALTGSKDTPWWYLQVEDMACLTRLLRGEAGELDGDILLETIDIGDGAEVFHLKFCYLNMICPLEPRILPRNAAELEPGTRLFEV